MQETALTTVKTGAIERSKAGLVEMWRKSLALDVAADIISQATADTYRRGMRKFIEWGQGNPEAATDQAIKLWLAHLRAGGASQAAVSVWFAGVRAFFQWAVSEAYLAADPTHGIKRGKRAGVAKAHKREMLTDDEMLRVLNSSLSKRNRALIHLLAYTAARGVEMHRANIEDLKTEGGHLVLYVQGKGRARGEKDEKIVIAHKDAAAAVYDYLAERKADSGPLFVSESNRTKDRRLSPRALRAIVREAFDQAGVTSRNKTTHSIRHSAITNAIRNGAALIEAQAMARHLNPATTQIYFHDLDRLEKAAEKLIDYRRPQNGESVGLLSSRTC